MDPDVDRSSWPELSSMSIEIRAQQYSSFRVCLEWVKWYAEKNVENRDSKYWTVERLEIEVMRGRHESNWVDVTERGERGRERFGR